MTHRTAVILCGGKGTRLGLLGKNVPKTLLKVHGKPILWYIIKFLKKILLTILFYQQVLKVKKLINILIKKQPLKN